ncbi:MAG: DUF4384 domain-containing protein [Candidatus Melainabacteria bacterium]|jgi:hypothetical protein|nr:DUF4384 domain-containing protein [Candidatus Melainabacteria bacterium]
MKAANRKLTLASILALAVSLSLGNGYALAEDKKSEPTVEDLKNSKERNVILLPRTSAVSAPQNTKQAAIKPIAGGKKTQAVKTAKKHQIQAKSPAKPANTNAGWRPAPVLDAANTQSADSIISVWLDKRGAAPQYKHGDKMKINVSASQDCNVMIFDFDGRGKLTQLFPNEYQQKTLLKAGDTITFGGSESPFDYQVSLPKGASRAQEKIFVYAYPITEKPLSIALSTEEGSPFRSGEMTLAQYKKLVAESKVFFSGGKSVATTSSERDVKIVPKSANLTAPVKLVAAEGDDSEKRQPNKKEVSFTILGK